MSENVSDPVDLLMLNPQSYPHDCAEVKKIETHISKVYLTGPYAYKVKKAVDFGFLDFTKLDARRHYCEEEIRLNSRLAESLYLDVIALCKKGDQLNLNNEGEAFEYAVRMQQFDTQQQLDVLLANNQLDESIADELGKMVAVFHSAAPTASSDSTLGSALQVMAPVQQNFDQILPLLEDETDIEQVKQLEQWSKKSFQIIEPLLVERKQNGFIRECHGDMHLGNMTFFEGKLQVFDGIEFNDEFRWIDTASEIAFFCMDLEFQKAQAFSRRFLDVYLSQSGDYEMACLLPFYKTYRALVRAKISLFTAQQQPKQSDSWQQLMQSFRDYVSLAEHYTQQNQAKCSITYGVSGSGKSWLAGELLKQIDLIRIASDVERQRFYSDLETSERYSEETTKKVYQHLTDLNQKLLSCGISTLLDATFLKKWQRDLIRQALPKDVQFEILAIESDEAQRIERITNRANDDDNYSDADEKVMKMQQVTLDALVGDELNYCKTIKNN